MGQEELKLEIKNIKNKTRLKKDTPTTSGSTWPEIKFFFLKKGKCIVGIVKHSWLNTSMYLIGIKQR